MMIYLSSFSVLYILHLLAMEPFLDSCQNVEILQMDLTKAEAFRSHLQDFLQRSGSNGSHLDCVMSDMAPNMSGIGHVDSIRSITLSTFAMSYALEWMKPNHGAFLTKILTGGSEQDFIRQVRSKFQQVHLIKPPASKNQSSELYILALRMRNLSA